MSKLRVTIWHEFRHEKTNEKVRKIYPDGMHIAIKQALEPFGEFISPGRKIAHFGDAAILTRDQQHVLECRPVIHHTRRQRKHPVKRLVRKWRPFFVKSVLHAHPVFSHPLHHREKEFDDRFRLCRGLDSAWPSASRQGQRHLTSPNHPSASRKGEGAKLRRRKPSQTRALSRFSSFIKARCFGRSRHVEIMLS